MRDSPRSWGRLPGPRQESVALWDRTDPLPSGNETLLPYGRGRSYGDSCLNRDGLVVSTEGLDRFIAFDSTAGTVRCEAGLRLRDLIDVTLPRGWFPAVVPGTQEISVGGAIANDVHGKNHHVAGTFASHVLRLELLRSDGERLVCSADEHPERFRATIGGLGLTGLITWAEIRLRKVTSALLDVEDCPFSSLEEFAALSTESDREFEYTVAWFDCYSYGGGRLRGIFSRGRHVEESEGTLSAKRPAPRGSVPFAMPGWFLGPASVRLFNTLYYATKRHGGRRRTRLESFLFPLDALRHWNLLYGPRGFMQLQCVFPSDGGMEPVARLLERVRRNGQGSFLTVLKRFGDRRSPGMLSFPMSGVTVALDLPSGSQTLALLAECHALIRGSGGRVYPAKDACMVPEVFASGYPAWREFLPHVDPRFASDFWRRTGAVLQN